MENVGSSAVLSQQISTGLASGCETTDVFAKLGLFGFAVSALGELTVCEQLMQRSTLGVQLRGRRVGGKWGNPL